VVHVCKWMLSPLPKKRHDSYFVSCVDYKVLRASTGSLSPLRNIPPPEQNTETRGTNTKTGPFIWAESGKDEIADNEKEVIESKRVKRTPSWATPMCG
jgi:hypothetical protein